MTRRAPLLAAVLAVISVISVIAMSASAAASTVFGPGLGGSNPAIPASFFRETLNYSTTLSTSQEANLYRMMVLQSSDAPHVPGLHAANQQLKLVMYQDDLFSSPQDPNATTVCTSYSANSSNHPSWFLLDQNGRRIIDRAYPGSYVMDVGNTGYQQACVARAIALAKSGGFDGVYFDDSTPNVAWTMSAGITSPRYPTAASWQTAEYAFLRYATAQVHAAHLLFVGNTSGSANYSGLWSKWAALMDGTEEQGFTDSGSGVAGTLWAWPTQLADAAWSESHGKAALMHSANTTEAGNTFGLGTMLLVAGGHDLYSTANGNFHSYEKWYPEYTIAEQMGAPSGPYQQLSNGVYRRAFASGLVLVNPTAKAVSSFSLGGGIYSGSGLSRVRSVAMNAASGLILQRVG